MVEIKSVMHKSKKPHAALFYISSYSLIANIITNKGQFFHLSNPLNTNCLFQVGNYFITFRTRNDKEIFESLPLQ